MYTTKKEMFDCINFKDSISIHTSKKIPFCFHANKILDDIEIAIVYILRLLA